MKQLKRSSPTRWMLLLFPAAFLVGLGLAYWGITAWRASALPEAIPVTFGRLEFEVGKRVVLEGYLELPDKAHPLRSDYLLLYARQPHAPFDRFIVVYFNPSRTGKPNSMRPLPENYARQDIFLTAADGRPVRAGDRVRLTGWSAYKYLDCERISLDEVDTIELLP
jgi:hypothetical protein